VPPRKLSPLERPASTGGRAPEMIEPGIEQYESVTTHTNRIPLPHLERPVFVHFDERPPHQDDEVEVYVM